jgi:hypothetical protein
MALTVARFVCPETFEMTDALMVTKADVKMVNSETAASYLLD